MRWLALTLAIVLILSCFFPWAVIESKGITISGIQAAGTNFGKPGYMNLLLAGLILCLILPNRTLTQRIALFLAAFNTAWAVRNFVLIPTCYGGICPTKKAAIYIMLASSLLLLLCVAMVKPQIKQEVPV